MVLSFGFTPTWLAMIISIWAILVSVARVGLGVHYLSDVIAGMILGGCIGTAYLSFIS
jgi:membrane-associated phospholipid phosphatase